MAKQTEYGLGNPHPLSKMRTELVWEGKYDEYGNRREVNIAGLAMPLQKIETIDQPRSEAAAAGQLDMFEKKSPRRDDFRNRLIWGDNKLVMASLLKEFKGKIDLIYIDPPFDVGADFTMQVPVGDEDEFIEKDQSTLEMVAYRDTWGLGTDSYVQMLYERLLLARDLLSEVGSIYVHCDWRVSAYIRQLMEDVFGSEKFLNEIAWRRSTPTGGKTKSRMFPRDYDVLVAFRAGERNIFNNIYLPYSAEYIEKFFYHKDPDGRRYCSQTLGDYSAESIAAFEKQGRIIVTKSGSKRLKQYLDESKGILADDIWTDIRNVRQEEVRNISKESERLDYPTQKPESLLERIIMASSNDDSIVADLFCGSGTTAAVAERMGRRWVMADLGRFAVHTSRKRLIELQRNLNNEGQSYRAFDVYNLGRYERQWWQKERLKGADDEHRRVVLEFFKAEQLSNAPSSLIHGRKNGAFVHVDSIDSIFTRTEAIALALAVAAAGGRECYVLAWEFEMDLRLALTALEQQPGVKIKPVLIPREIMEKNLRTPPPFFEMAVVEAEPVIRKNGNERAVDIKLTKFLPSLAEVPSKELEAIQQRAIRSGMDFIDFWAVDFDWKAGQPFNHHWQDYRTRKDRSLKTVSDAGHIYAKRGKYIACVKVVDTFGSDTSITVAVEV